MQCLKSDSRNLNTFQPPKLSAARKLMMVTMCAMLSVMMLGCSQPAQEQKETRTPQEQLNAYEASPEVDKFYYELMDNLKLCISASESGDMKTAIEKSVLVENIYEGLKEMKDVPEAVAELHQCYITTAEHMSNAAQYESDAATDKAVNDTVSEKRNRDKATEEINKGTEALNNSGAIKTRIRDQK